MKLSKEEFEKKFLKESGVFSLTINPETANYSVALKIAGFVRGYLPLYNEYFSWMISVTMTAVYSIDDAVLSIKTNEEFGEKFGYVMVYKDIYYDPVLYANNAQNILGQNKKMRILNYILAALLIVSTVLHYIN